MLFLLRRNHRCRGFHVRVLGPVPQQVVHQHDGQHRFGNGRGADAHTGVVTTSGHHLRRVAMNINTRAGNPDAGCWFEGDVGNDILAGTDATQDSARVVAVKPLRADLVPPARRI